MPVTEFQKALGSLAVDFQRQVNDVFAIWAGDVNLGQVSQNIVNETALSADDFISLLNSFATEVASGNTPVDSWLKACRLHKRKRNTIPTANCPIILGRAKGLDDHANSVARSSTGSITQLEAKKLLIKYSGRPDPVALDPFLRATPLGKFNLVWATFDSIEPDKNPFNRLPKAHGDICTVLGLGGLTDTLIILVWNHANAGKPPLHRPTIADAEVYPYYRPNPDLGALWGLTEPLLPNLGGWKPQPELVLPDPTSIGLLLPFVVVPV